MRAQGFVLDDFVESTLHAEHPCIALGRPNVEMHMALSQPGMAALLRIELGAAKPFAEISFEDILDGGEVIRVNGADALRLRQCVHAMIEALHQTIDGSLAADLRKQRRW